MDFKIRFAGSILNSYEGTDERVQNIVAGNIVTTVNDIHILSVDAPLDISNRNLTVFNISNVLPILTEVPSSIISGDHPSSDYNGFYSNAETNSDFFSYYLGTPKISEGYIPLLNAGLIRYGYLDVNNVIEDHSIGTEKLNNEINISELIDWNEIKFTGEGLDDNSVRGASLMENTITYNKYQDYSIGNNKIIDSSISIMKAIKYKNVVNNPVPSYYLNDDGSNTLLDGVSFQGGGNLRVDYDLDYITMANGSSEYRGLTDIFNNCYNLNTSNLNIAFQCYGNRLQLFFDVFDGVDSSQEYSDAVNKIKKYVDLTKTESIEYRYPTVCNDNVYQLMQSEEDSVNLNEIVSQNKHQLLDWTNFNKIQLVRWQGGYTPKQLLSVVINVPSYFADIENTTSVQGTLNTYGLYKVGTTYMTQHFNNLNLGSDFVLTPHSWQEIYAQDYTTHSNNAFFYRINNSGNYVYNGTDFESTPRINIETYYNNANSELSPAIQSIVHDYINNTTYICEEQYKAGDSSTLTSPYYRNGNILLDAVVNISNYLPYIDNRDYFKSNVVFELSTLDYGILSNIRFDYDNSHQSYFENPNSTLTVDIYGEFYRQDYRCFSYCSNVSDLNNINTPFLDTTMYSEFTLENIQKRAIVNTSTSNVVFNSNLPNIVIYGSQNAVSSISNITVSQNDNKLISYNSSIAFMKHSRLFSDGSTLGQAFNYTPTTNYRVEITYEREEPNVIKTYSLGSNESQYGIPDWSLDSAIDKLLANSSVNYRV